MAFASFRAIDSREAAVLQNNKTYSTGKPCRKGHESERYTSSGNCVACMREKAEAKRLVAKSIRHFTKHRSLGNPHLFSCSAPIEWHDTLEKLVKAINCGSSEWTRDLEAMLLAVLSTEIDPGTGKPFATAQT